MKANAPGTRCGTLLFWNNVDITGYFEHRKNDQGDEQYISTGRSFVDALVNLRYFDIGHCLHTGNSLGLDDTTLYQARLDPVALGGNAHEFGRNAEFLNLIGCNHTRLGGQTRKHDRQAKEQDIKFHYNSL
jgi:hypothetical protein